MDMVFDAVSWVLISGGVFFMVVGAIGLVRMPDVYTRLHAAGMTDTMGAGLILMGLCFQGGGFPVVVRLVLIWLFLLFTSPIGTHALARAALSGGVEPYRTTPPQGS
ncbi:MAG: monovalent cation/H(+) antiporter subunit G [Gemmatimonadota bacterium]|nr:monovalent cation/H(+) antiporter subunit G [Gemmatimonadota bacterium]MDH5759931.1 monovalent cation/H(+) antiporter subunit G [Gemmatimonadota bacterium]